MWKLYNTKIETLKANYNLFWSRKSVSIKVINWHYTIIFRNFSHPMRIRNVDVHSNYRYLASPLIMVISLTDLVLSPATPFYDSHGSPPGSRRNNCRERRIESCRCLKKDFCDYMNRQLENEEEIVFFFLYNLSRCAHMKTMHRFLLLFSFFLSWKKFIKILINWWWDFV